MSNSSVCGQYNFVIAELLVIMFHHSFILQSRGKFKIFATSSPLPQTRVGIHCPNIAGHTYSLFVILVYLCKDIVLTIDHSIMIFPMPLANTNPLRYVLLYGKTDKQWCDFANSPASPGQGESGESYPERSWAVYWELGFFYGKRHHIMVS